MNTQRARHAEIAGAGFAGLTAAAALAQRGWSVRVHERSKSLREEGAGIVLWQNSLKVLDSIGATPDIMSNSMTPPAYETRMQNKIVSQETLDGVRWRTLTRPHLYQSLLTAARESGAEIVTNSEVSGITANGKLGLVSGEELDADLFVGADGVSSKVRDSLGIEFERKRARDGITRFLVPRRKADLMDLEPDTEWDNVIDFWNFEPRILRILYTPANVNELYIALMSPVDDAEGTKVPIDVDLWSSIHPQLAPVIEEAGRTPGKYYRYQTTRLAEWTRGNVALIGDSAHAMCPALAQGAGCAMTNAFTLAEAATASSLQDLPDALKEWERLERPYTDRCQARSQEYADTRGMSQGGQFVGESMETALYDPTDSSRHKLELTAG